MDNFKRTFSMGVRSLGVIMMPLGVLLIIFSKQLIQVALQYGRFNAAATAITSQMLFFFGFAVYFYSVYLLAVRASYAMQDTKTPMKVYGAGVPVNIILNVTLVRVMGVAGLALSQAITIFFNSILIFYLLRKRVGPLGAGRIIKSTAKYAVGSLALGATAYVFFLTVTQPYWQLSFGVGKLAKVFGALFKGGQLLSAALIGGLIYVAVMFLLKAEEVSIIKRFGRRLVSFVKA